MHHRNTLDFLLQTVLFFKEQPCFTLPTEILQGQGFKQTSDQAVQMALLTELFNIESLYEISLCANLPSLGILYFY